MALQPQAQQLYRVGNSRNEFAQDLDWLSAVSQRLWLMRTPNKCDTRLTGTLVPSGSVFNTHSSPVPDIRTVVPCMSSQGGGVGGWGQGARNLSRMMCSDVQKLEGLCVVGVSVYLCSSSNGLLIQGRSWNVVGTLLSANSS